MNLSILICTHNGEKKLPQTFGHLLSLDTSLYGKVQLVVVNNASADGTVDTIRAWDGQLKKKFGFMALDAPLPGKLNALRMGVLACEHEFLLLCDDDNLLAQDYLAVAYPTLSKNPRLGALGGVGILPPSVENASKPAWFGRYAHVFAVGPQAEKSGKLESFDHLLWGAGTFYRTAPYKKLFRQNYPFLLSALRGKNLAGGDDTEFGIILKILGFETWYDERLHFIHDIDMGRVSETFMKKRFMGFGRSRLVVRAYLHCVHHGPIPQTRLPYWLDRYLYLRKQYKKALAALAEEKDADRIFDLQLSVLAQEGELRYLWELKWKYHKFFDQVNGLIAEKQNFQL